MPDTEQVQPPRAAPPRTEPLPAEPSQVGQQAAENLQAEAEQPESEHVGPGRISAADVSKVATLARLTLTADELVAVTAELGAMLDHFADIDALDLDGVEPMMQPTPMVNVMRDDVVGSTLDRDEVLGQAPSTEDGRFRVPPIIGIEA